MEKMASEKPANKWLNVPIIATITRLSCRELTLQNEYLRQEKKLRKSKIKKRIVLPMTIDCCPSYFNEHRPHQGIGNRIPALFNMKVERQGGHLPDIKSENVARKKFLGGRLKSYQTAA